MKHLIIGLLCLCAFAAKSQKISELPAATNVTGAVLPIVQGGTTKKVPFDTVLNPLNTAIGLKLNKIDTAALVSPYATAINKNIDSLNAHNTRLIGKQATLVSATNIKTVNGTSLLGSGDLVISGGGGSSTFAGLGLLKVVDTIKLDTSYGKKYFSTGLFVVNDSTVRVDTLGLKSIYGDVYKANTQTFTGANIFNPSLATIPGTQETISGIRITGAYVGNNSGDTAAALYIKPTISGSIGTGRRFAIFTKGAASNFDGIYFGHGNSNNDASQNIAIGASAGVAYNNSAGAANLAIGDNTLQAVTSGFYNIGIGYFAGATITTGTDNVMIGAGAQRASANTSANTFIGVNAGYSATGNSSSGIGRGAGYSAGSNGVYLGKNAGFSDTRDNKFHVSNTNTGSLLFGDFAEGRLMINSTGSTPTFSSGAAFEVNALGADGTRRGSIPFPLMTAAQRTAISSPAIGLHVYQTDGVEGVYVNKSTGWVLAY